MPSCPDGGVERHVVVNGVVGEVAQDLVDVARLHARRSPGRRLQHSEPGTSRRERYTRRVLNEQLGNHHSVGGRPRGRSPRQPFVRRTGGFFLETRHEQELSDRGPPGRRDGPGDDRRGPQGARRRRAALRPARPTASSTTSAPDATRATARCCPTPSSRSCKTVDAIYKGPVGSRYPGDEVPPGILERGLILKIRFELDQYINLRPVKLFPGVPCPLVGKGPEDIDFVVVRENTEGLYAAPAASSRRTRRTRSPSRRASTRARASSAASATRSSSRALATAKKLTLVHKTNVLTTPATSGSARSRKSARSTPTSRGTTTTSTRAACGSCRRPSASTSSSPTTCSATSSRTSPPRCRAAWASPPAATSTPKACRCSSRSAARPPTSPGKNEINPMAAIGAMQMMLAPPRGGRCGVCCRARAWPRPSRA